MIERKNETRHLEIEIIGKESFLSEGVWADEASFLVQNLLMDIPADYWFIIEHYGMDSCRLEEFISRAGLIFVGKKRHSLMGEDISSKKGDKDLSDSVLIRYDPLSVKEVFRIAVKASFFKWWLVPVARGNFDKFFDSSQERRKLYRYVKSFGESGIPYIYFNGPTFIVVLDEKTRDRLLLSLQERS